jgi:DNA-binding GntR family transcriptional regulator
MNSPVKRVTLSEAAYQAIRREIITGALTQGSKLVVSTLAKALCLSATPINEALAALEREGLVSYAPHRGYFVWTITQESIEQIYSIREVFETLAVRYVAQSAERSVIDQLQEILRQAQRTVRSTDTTKFSELDWEFHRTIWSSTKNSLAIRIGEFIDGQIQMLTTTAAREPGRFRGALNEHLEIFRAIKNRDVAEAEAATRKHISNAKIALERAVSTKSAKQGANAKKSKTKKRTAR